MTKLIVGLGNPGPEYVNTRHNIGFLIIDHFAQSVGVDLQRNKYHGVFGEFHPSGGEKVILVKPQTYMNVSGECVAPWINFLKLPGESVLILHDELDLEFGQMKAQWAAGPAGHGGIKNIIKSLGHQDFCRLRVGVGHPGERKRVVRHVLSPFTGEEQGDLTDLLDRGVEAVRLFIEKGLDPVAQLFNTKGPKN